MTLPKRPRMEPAASLPDNTGGKSFYQPLNTDRHEIRLLYVLPSDDMGTPPQCTLQTVSLDDQPTFEALSYLWGDPKNTSVMYLGGEPFHVTKNLHSALRHLRDPIEVKVLWADAVCVDQKNYTERSQQVSFMTKIFRNATVVRVWLGEPTPEKSHGFRVAQKLYRIRSELDKQHVDVSKLDLSCAGTHDCQTPLVCLGILCATSYWRRVWVLQEVLLSIEEDSIRRSRGIVHLGSCCMDQSKFSTSIFYLRDCLRLSRRDLSRRPTLKIIQKVLGRTDVFSDYLKIDHLQHATVDQDPIFNRSIRLMALRTLAVGRHFKATDPRDKVYGLLGLIPQLNLEASYEKSAESTFRDATILLINDSHSLDVLSELARLGSSSAQSKPSWAAEFGFSGTHPYLRYTELYNACLDHPTSQQTAGSSILALRGHLIGELEYSGSTLKKHWHGNGITADIVWLNALRNLAVEAYAICRSSRLQYNNGTTAVTRNDGSLGGVKDALWSTLLTNRRVKNSRWLTRFVVKTDPAYLNLLESDILDETPSSQAWERLAVLRHDLYRILGQQVFARLTSGHIGLVPDSSRRGDVVYVLAGGPCPFVLRPVGSDPLRTYILVGPAYIHGIMDGESVAESAKWVSTGNPDAYDMAFDEEVLLI